MQAGEAGEPDCPVTPVAGQWVAIDPDPYGFELVSDGSHLSGQGCLAGLPSAGDAILCSPLALQADRGRHVAFTWDMKQAKGAPGIAYFVKMELTLSPERTAMAGKVWTSLGSLDGEGYDVVLVRYPEQPVPPATSCSGGEPSGACFLGPLRSDRFNEPRVVELGGGNLLVLWMSRRGVDSRLAGARFDAATGAWQAAEFLDDGSAPVDAPLVAASPAGWAMVAYRQNDALVTRGYDPKTNAWSEQQLVAANDGSFSNPDPKTLFVYDGGDATLIASAGLAGLTAVDYVAEKRLWESPHAIVAPPNVDATEWAAASDAARNALVVWVRGTAFDQPFDVWSSARSAAGTWTAPAQIYTGSKQIIKPAVAIGKDGAAIATWQEWITRIASSSYSFKTGVWSEPLTVAPEQAADNGAVAFSDAGSPFAYFHRNNAFGDTADQRTELIDGVWSAPQTIPPAEANGASYSVTGGGHGVQVTPLHPRAGQSPQPLLLPRCDGY